MSVRVTSMVGDFLEKGMLLRVPWGGGRRKIRGFSVKALKLKPSGFPDKVKVLSYITRAGRSCQLLDLSVNEL